MKKIGIYPILDTQWLTGTPIQPNDWAKSLGKRPVSLVQLRAKGENTKANWLVMVTWMQALRRWAPHVNVIINDRPDICLALEADGVHIGQDDLPVAICRKLLGPDRLIGLSTHTLHQVKTADVERVDYLGFGPIFQAGGAKPDALPPRGIEALAQICQATSLPVVAIGGIGMTHIAQIKATHAAGIAMIGALFPQAGPTTSQRLLKEACQVWARH
ncbi:MAG: thiamine phosphate synthase [Magnetococcus sp. DMHC-6]